MKSKKDIRQSNFELMRIGSMFMIALWHMLCQGGILDSTTGLVNALLTFLKGIIVVHVNSFIIVTGYFQCRNKFRFDKFISLVNLTWFYKIIILLIVLLCGVSISKLEILKNISPINYQDYWFLANYVLLYLISPILNKVINNSSKSEFRKILLVLFLIISVLPSLTAQVAFNNNYGYSLSNFILLYFIGAYLRFYFDINNFKKISIINIRFFLSLIFLAIVLFNVLCYFLANKLASVNFITAYISNVISSLTFSYDNPLVIFQTIVYFLLFATLTINSKFINNVSKTMLGVYLIHTNKLLRSYVYKYFGMTSYMNSGVKVLFFLFVHSIILFILCSLIDFIRIFIFRFISKCNTFIKLKEWFRRNIHERIAL